MNLFRLLYPFFSQSPVPSREKLTETLIETIEETEERIDETYERELVLFKTEKDDIHYITEVLVKVCKLSGGDAFSVASEAQEKGFSTITTGTFNQLKPLRKGVTERQLWAEIL